MSSPAPGIDTLRTPDERFRVLPGFPYEPRYVDDLPGFDPLRVGYVDEGPPDATTTFLCLHGEPTWGYLYRKMIPLFTAAGHRAVAPDLFGFGRSDKPTDRRWYSYDRHTELVGRLLGSLDLRDATVVVQDWGGPIGLRWAVENADRVGRLVILNTGLFTGRVSQGFMAWRQFAERNPDLPIGFVVQGATSTELEDAVVAGYEAPFPHAESKAGAAQFPLLVPLSEDDPGAAEMRAVAEPFIRRRAIRHLEKGRVVIFGAGTGNPYFTTDTAASLRAIEIEADVILKGTRVDGIYDSDPEKNSGAIKFDTITGDEVLDKRLNVMDLTAFTLCRDNRTPIIVFNMNVPGNLKKVVCSSETVGSTVVWDKE